MIKLGAISACTWGIPIPHFLEDLIFHVHGEIYPCPWS
jgi:hypothetical protein